MGAIALSNRLFYFSQCLGFQIRLSNIGGAAQFFVASDFLRVLRCGRRFDICVICAVFGREIRLWIFSRRLLRINSRRSALAKPAARAGGGGFAIAEAEPRALCPLPAPARKSAKDFCEKKIRRAKACGFFCAIPEIAPQGIAADSGTFAHRARGDSGGAE